METRLENPRPACGSRERAGGRTEYFKNENTVNRWGYKVHIFNSSKPNNNNIRITPKKRWSEVAGRELRGRGQAECQSEAQNEEIERRVKEGAGVPGCDL